MMLDLNYGGSKNIVSFTRVLNVVRDLRHVVAGLGAQCKSFQWSPGESACKPTLRMV